MFNQQRGLTLVELLVAISVLAIVAVLGWRGLDGIVRARITLTGDLEQTRGMQLTFAQLQSDCLQLSSPALLLDRPTILTKTNQLNLVRTVLSEGRPAQLQVVSYSVQGGVLMRRESPDTRDLKMLDTMWQAAINNTDASPAVILQSGVTNMNMRLWFSGANGWNIPAVVSPTTPANPAITPTLPTGLEVSLQLAGQQTGLLKVFLLGAL